MSFDEYVEVFGAKGRQLIVPLSPRQLAAIGHVIVQWGHLEQRLNWQIRLWRMHPSVPAAIRTERVRSEFNKRMSYLQTLAGLALSDVGDVFKDEFGTILKRASRCHDRRSWFAHGTFALDGNETDDTITVTYLKPSSGTMSKYRIKTETVEALANEIAALSGDLMSFETRARANQLRALFEKLDTPDGAH